jgi:hypothetical protein
VILATFATIGIFALKINHLAIWTKLSGHEMQFFDCPAWRVNPGYFFFIYFLDSLLLESQLLPLKFEVGRARAQTCLFHLFSKARALS